MLRLWHSGAFERVTIMKALNGKRALITGGASGIGRATALLFARQGAAVSIVDLDAEGGEAAARELLGAGGRAVYIPADLTKAVDCQRAVQRTVDGFGRIDILVNSVGIIRRATVLETTEKDWDRIMAVNVKSIYLLSKYAIPVLERSGGGSIINIASGWGLVGGPKAVAYCASKGAVVQMTRAMAIDHGGQNIRVNCICPGDTDTPMLRYEASQLGAEEESFLAEAAYRPLGRIGRPEEIAQAALYLASEASSYVTGTTLVVDGGGLAG
jgi:NAD(P)-dependent dehydrogenase (short-subunit alcohol dehydrogenase family)